MFCPSETSGSVLGKPHEVLWSKVVPDETGELCGLKQLLHLQGYDEEAPRFAWDPWNHNYSTLCKTPELSTGSRAVLWGVKTVYLLPDA